MQEAKWQTRISSWMTKGGQGVPNAPTVPDRKTRKLRARLILEEAIETCGALGIEVCVDGAGTLTMDRLAMLDRPEWIEPEEIVDGCCDVMVVTLGTLSACGIDADEHMNEVLSANEAKYADGVIRDSGGKILKPEGWEPPKHGKYLPQTFLDEHGRLEDLEQLPLFHYASCSDPNWDSGSCDVDSCEETDCCDDCDCSMAGRVYCKIKRWFHGGK